MHQLPSIPDQALTACPPCTVDPVLRSRAGSFLAFGPSRLVVGVMLCLERPDNTGKSPSLGIRQAWVWIPLLSLKNRTN